MPWEQIQELATNGMEIGTHTVDHKANLAQLSTTTQRRAIEPARNALAKNLPNALPLFAYPSGSYDINTLDILRDLGYVAVVTTKQGVLQSSAHPLELKRIRIRGEWSFAEFFHWLDYWTTRK